MKELPVHNVSFGNDGKCGKGCATISRPTIQTCPPHCPFATGKCSDGREIPKRFRCYASRCERRRPNVELNWRRGIQGDYGKWERQTADKLVQLATRTRGRRLTCFRIHVGGDICRDGKVDRDYMYALCNVLAELRDKAPNVGVWLYTHAWRELAKTVFLSWLRDYGVQVLASVHTPSEADEAVALGYRLAVDLGERTPDSATADYHGHKVTVCPHQRGKVEDCEACGFCFKDNGRHVGFILH